MRRFCSFEYSRWHECDSGLASLFASTLRLFIFKKVIDIHGLRDRC